MASVSSLDKDLRRLRLEKYTPAAANEARAWIEEALGQKLSSSDLLEGLKDGVALCKYVWHSITSLLVRDAPVLFDRKPILTPFLPFPPST